MANYPEKKIITLSLFVLFLSLMIIYVLLFNIKWNELKINLETPTTNNIEIDTNNNDNNNTEITNSYKNIETLLDNNTWDNQTNTWIQTWIETSINELTWNQTINQSGDFGFTVFETEMNQVKAWEITIDNTDDIYILSGTERYFGALMSIEKLWIDYKYALKDDKDIYYISLKDKKYDFDSITRELSGSTYKLTSEQDISNNNLFGKKITFINIPEFKNKIVIILIETKNMERLIQISYSIYHESKDYLAQIIDN